MNNNPFSVSSPETMDAAEMLRLYVPLAGNFEIGAPGHMFVHGHRGCGKSMMLRLMAPDCKMLELKCGLEELPYLGLYASIKSTDLDIAEFERIKNQFAGLVLAEHSLCLFVASKVLQSLRDHCGNFLKEDEIKSEFINFLFQTIFNRLDFKIDLPIQDAISAAISAIDTKYNEFMDYMRQLSLTESYIPFAGRVVGYRDFLFPFCSGLTTLNFFPKGKPTYILLDDADNLNHIQTLVLNTWVSYRTDAKLSFKISTQLGYKHHRTSSNQRIECPHDYKEVNISTIYTGSSGKGAYPSWVEEIVTKRLIENGISSNAKDFFPVAREQEEEIEKIKTELKQKWEVEGRGYRPGDDATRYARPDYIKSLGGMSKQGRTYLYAGFEQLVHISSGIIRYFLEAAATMYADESKESLSNGRESTEVCFIRPRIQDQVVRDRADALMIDSLDQLVEEANEAASHGESKNDFKKLRNLIQSLGGIFQHLLMSDRSERRVFSIALSDSPSDEVMSVLKLGVRHGFLYEGTIGAKDGRGRTRRFVLTRRLAPMYKLDPTGFAGYLFVTSAFLEIALVSPTRAIRELESTRLGIIEEDPQISMEFV